MGESIEKNQFLRGGSGGNSRRRHFPFQVHEMDDFTGDGVGDVFTHVLAELSGILKDEVGWSVFGFFRCGFFLEEGVDDSDKEEYTHQDCSDENTSGGVGECVTLFLFPSFHFFGGDVFFVHGTGEVETGEEEEGEDGEEDVEGETGDFFGVLGKVDDTGEGGGDHHGETLDSTGFGEGFVGVCP